MHGARSRHRKSFNKRDELDESRRGIHLTRSMGCVVICALGEIEGGREGGSERVRAVGTNDE